MLQAFERFFEDISTHLEYRWMKKSKEDTVYWKNEMAEKWGQADREEKLTLAREIVSVWGGVRRNSPETLAHYVDLADAAHPPLPLDGVTSYSKIFSIVDRKKYAVYDSRVSAALNAVQLIDSKLEGQKICFNYVDGQNRAIKHFMKTFPCRLLVGMGWRRIHRDDTYQMYLDLLSELSKNYKKELHDFEMTLFANAEDLCNRAIAQHAQHAQQSESA